MTALWILFAVVVSALLAGWAVVAERLMLQHGWPARWPWAAAMAGSLLIPLGSFRVASPAGAGPAQTDGALAGGASGWIGGGLTVLPASQGWITGLEPWLLGAWAAGSALALLSICRAALTLRSRSATWMPARVAGEAVLISRDTGPAAAGILRPRIVVPAWVLSADETARRLLVAHEREHHRARDPLLLLAARLALALVPWNLPLRWQLHRLRTAVEIDCDARVLRRTGGAARSYGMLLLEAGRLAGRPTPALALAAPGVLERRLRVLAGERPRLTRRTRRAALGLAVAAPLLVMALPTPPPPDLGAVRALLGSDAPGETGHAALALEPGARAELLNRYQAPEILRRRYPARLREAGIGGTVVVDAYVDETGSVREMRVHEGSGERELDRAALEVMRELRFSPARAGGRAIPVWVQHPVIFLPGEAEGAAGPPVRIAIWTSGR